MNILIIYNILINNITKADSLPHPYDAYHGGAAILYKRSLQFSINEMHNLDSERIVGIELKGQSFGSIFIFGVYLPSNENIDQYKDICIFLFV